MRASGATVSVGVDAQDQCVSVSAEEIEPQGGPNHVRHDLMPPFM